MNNRLVNKSAGQVLAEKVIIARSFFARARGLMGKKDFPASQAFWILPCKGGIHTFFMKFPVDVIFINQSLKITRVFQNVKPWKTVYFSSLFSSTHSVFEFKTPALENRLLQKGDQLYVGH